MDAVLTERQHGVSLALGVFVEPTMLRKVHSGPPFEVEHKAPPRRRYLHRNRVTVATLLRGLNGISKISSRIDPDLLTFSEIKRPERMASRQQRSGLGDPNKRVSNGTT